MLIKIRSIGLGPMKHRYGHRTQQGHQHRHR